MAKLTSKKLETLADKVNIKVTKHDGDPEKFIEKFKEVWPVVREVLEAVKIITGDKVDKVIDDLLKLGDKITTGKGTVADQAKLIKKLCQNWKKIRRVLKVVKIITPKKVDKVINKFIALGDLVCR